MTHRMMMRWLVGVLVLLTACRSGMTPAATGTDVSATTVAAGAGATARSEVNTAQDVPAVAASPTRPASPATSIKAAAATPPSTLEAGMKVDVGGFALWIQCTGQGSPTVVMDAGSGNTAAAWARVQPGTAAFTRVCIYDRAGLGHSDPGPKPTSSQQIVQALHTLLTNAGVAGPYVPVGHSFGGLNMQLFARLYPSEVVGLVLVDAVNEQHYLDSAAGLPKYSSEGVDLQKSGLEVQAAPPLPDIPLIVLSHGRPGDLPAYWEQHWPGWQQDLASRSPHGKLIVVENSGHEIEKEQPDVVVSAIREVVDDARSSSR